MWVFVGRKYVGHKLETRSKTTMICIDSPNIIHVFSKWSYLLLYGIIIYRLVIFVLSFYSPAITILILYSPTDTY